MQENECGQSRLLEGASIEHQDDLRPITHKENNASHPHRWSNDLKGCENTFYGIFTRVQNQLSNSNRMMFFSPFLNQLMHNVHRQQLVSSRQLVCFERLKAFDRLIIGFRWFFSQSQLCSATVMFIREGFKKKGGKYGLLPSPPPTPPLVWFFFFRKI